MKEILLDEAQLENLQTLGAALFTEDASDPRSWFYKRQLVRPAIRWHRILLFILLLFLGPLCGYYLLTAFSVLPDVAFWISLASVPVVLVIYLKRIFLCFIRIYQRYAPAAIRNKCRFEPSCSQYMALSIQKYGLLRGLKKGINRMKRCNTTDGGFDFP